jgi:hypothetical protein
MNPDAALKKYIALVSEHKSGRLTREDFLAEIEKLRFQDEAQSWWQATEDGTCLKWDGSAWQATDRKIDAPEPITAAGSTAGTGAPPPTGANVESKAGRYIKHILIRIPFVILSFFLTWAIHTYLLADVNGGFGQGGAGNWVFSNWRNFLSSTILWGLLSGFVWMLIFTWFKLGRKNFLPTLTRAPVMMIERIQQAGTPGVGALLIGLGLALFFSPFNVITGNVGVGLALFLAVFGLSSLGWAIARFIARVWLWIIRTVVKKPEEKYGVSLSAAHLIMVGLIPGFVVSLVLKGAFGFLTGIVLMVLGVFLFFEIKSPTISNKTTGFILCISPFILQMLMVACFPDLAFADNGGKSEAGGTWALWWGSQGFYRVLLYGIPPAIASGIGALFPTLTLDSLIQIPPDAAGPIKPGMVLGDSLKFGDLSSESPVIPVSIDTSTPRWDSFSGPDDEVTLTPSFYSTSTTVSEYSPQVMFLQAITGGLKVVGFVCDTAMSTLSNVTGPVGKTINLAYIGTKDVAGEMSDAQAKFSRGQTEYETLSDALEAGAKKGAVKGVLDATVEIGGDFVGGSLGFNKYASGIFDYLDGKKILTNRTASGLVKKLAGIQKDYFQYFTKYTRTELRHGVDIPGAIKEVIESAPGETAIQLGQKGIEYVTDPAADAVAEGPTVPPGEGSNYINKPDTYYFRR